MATCPTQTKTADTTRKNVRQGTHVEHSIFELESCVCLLIQPIIPRLPPLYGQYGD